MDFENIRSIAIASAYHGGGILQSHFGKIKEARKKGAIDLVTEADIRSEQIILDVIKSVFPDHSVLAEESGSSRGDSDKLWIIDPLDGTTNYTHGLDQFAVSIAFSYKGEVCVGIVFNPMSRSLFSGIKGKGAFLNRKKIGVSSSSNVSESLLVTGFPYSLKEHMGQLTDRFTSCLKSARGIRRLGAASLDLCYVACGRFDGFWEENLKPWDTAAGFLIAKEAGARVTDFSNSPFSLDKNQILATNGNIHDEMLTLLEV